MRCYFMRNGHIAGVEFLDEATDEAQIARARELFAQKGAAKSADGFEVWDGARFLYRYPEDATKRGHP